MNSNSYKIMEPRNLKIEKNPFEIQKTMLYIYKDMKKEIQIIKEKLEKIKFWEKITEKRNKTTIEYLTEHIAKIKWGSLKIAFFVSQILK